MYGQQISSHMDAATVRNATFEPLSWGENVVGTHNLVPANNHSGALDVISMAQREPSPGELQSEEYQQ